MEQVIKATMGGSQPVPVEVVDERQAAAYLNLSVKTLQARRASYKAPPFLKIGRSIRYRLADLDAFLAAHRVDPEARAWGRS